MRVSDFGAIRASEVRMPHGAHGGDAQGSLGQKPRVTRGNRDGGPGFEDSEPKMVAFGFASQFDAFAMAK